MVGLIWRAWGRRLVACPFVVWLILDAELGTTLALVALVVLGAMVSWAKVHGHLDPLLVHEQGHVLRCRIRRRWRRATRGASLWRADWEPKIRWPIHTAPGGVRFQVKPADGHHAGTWQAAIPALSSSFKVSEIEVIDVVSRKGEATGRLQLTCSTLGVVPTIVEWPHKLVNPWWSANDLPIGVGAASRLVQVSLRDPPHVLVGGTTGGGKSSFLATMLAGLSPLYDEAFVLVDLKGLDLHPWAPRAAGVVSTPEECGKVLRWAEKLMELRLVMMAGEGIDSWTSSPERPHLTVVIDEFRDVPIDQHKTVETLTRKGRAAGISVVLCTQWPSHILGPLWTAIRTNLGTRLVVGHTSRHDAELTLDAGNMPSIWPRFPAGVGRLVQPGQATRTVRIYWTKPQARSIANLTADRRPDLIFPAT